tara:strand:- start:267 stop:584 length:318 start_codon:yes stop_codon:yes gene_type:complete
MSVKLAILQSKEQVIAEIKELVDDGNPVGYIFANPHCVYADKQYLAEDNEDRSVQITLSPWILLTADKEILVPKNQVITIVEPIDSVKEMYSEKVNGSDGTSTDK